MSARGGTILLVAVLGTWSAPRAVPAQQMTPAPERAPGDAGKEAMRREVEARVREQRMRLERIRAELMEGLRNQDHVVVRVGRANVVVRRIAIPQATPAGDRAAEPKLVIVPEAFDQVVYGESGASKDVWHRLDLLLDQRVREAGREWRLPSETLARIRLAGRGDIKRMSDLVEQRRLEFDGMRSDVGRFQAHVPELLRLRTAIDSINFGEGSLFAKTLAKLLEDEWPAGVSATWGPDRAGSPP